MLCVPQTPVSVRPGFQSGSPFGTDAVYSATQQAAANRPRIGGQVDHLLTWQIAQPPELLLLISMHCLAGRLARGFVAAPRASYTGTVLVCSVEH